MKILVFGATGKTGWQVVQQALAKGHEVTAFARNPSGVGIAHPLLKTVIGDVLDASSVVRAVTSEYDAVVCCIGSPANKIGNIRSQGTKNIIDAMEKAGLKRFICQTSLGYGDSVKTLDQTPWFFKHLIVPYVLKKGFADHALQEKYIKESNLDWVIARPGNLTDGSCTKAYKHGFAADDNNISVKISRADVADFMLKQLDSNEYLKQTIGLSYAK